MAWIDWENVPEEIIVEGVRRKMVSSENMTIVLWFWDKGVDLPAHTHPHEQFYYLVSGKAIFESAGHKRLLDQPGSSWMVHGNVPHSTTYLEDSVTMDIFSPPRKDMMAGVDPYIRKATKKPL
ncbi:cupin domain-containing protein [Pendulispora albinea]|uniref:Cupin domain-containing protein n=1 Tax=Pendulispora albinea TaxID=2741071 RepID=A0ABZ2M712_9BACT